MHGHGFGAGARPGPWRKCTSKMAKQAHDDDSGVGMGSLRRGRWTRRGLGVEHGDSGGGCGVGSFRCRLAGLRVVCGGVSGVVGSGGAHGGCTGRWGMRRARRGSQSRAQWRGRAVPQARTGRSMPIRRSRWTSTVTGAGHNDGVVEKGRERRKDGGPGGWVGAGSGGQSGGPGGGTGAAARAGWQVHDQRFGADRRGWQRGRCTGMAAGEV